MWRPPASGLPSVLYLVFPDFPLTCLTSTFSQTKPDSEQFCFRLRCCLCLLRLPPCHHTQLCLFTAKLLDFCHHQLCTTHSHFALCYLPTTGACKILLFHTDCTWLNMVYRYNKEYCVKCCVERSPASWRQSWKEEEALWVSTSFLQIAGVKVFS